MNTTNEIPEIVDTWIDSIPNNPYDLCPCGCGKKWKYAKQETMYGVIDHWQNFYKKMLANFIKE
jgi:hypothetical protein